MTRKVGIKGQVVIPKEIRDEIGIQPGDEVVFEADGTEIKVRRANQDPRARAAKIREPRGRWSDQPIGGTVTLEQERRRERDAEERRAQRWGVGRP